VILKSGKTIMQEEKDTTYKFAKTFTKKDTCKTNTWILKAYGHKTQNYYVTAHLSRNGCI
jgi:hypothetical protein